MALKKTILFYQHFGNKHVFRGAHYKTLDYYNHIKQFKNFEPVIAFDLNSEWGPDIPWFHMFEIMPTLESIDTVPDILFLNSGKDWLKYQEVRLIPDGMNVISPVNHFRALNPDHRAFSLLSQKATRLCPSPELFKAVSEHQLTNGITVYLPNAVEKVYNENIAWNERTTQILVVGNKNPQLARNIEKSLFRSGFKLKVIDEWMSKVAFQKELSNSQVTIHLPKAVEAHYIPAIESMMYGSIVVMPDCKGNRSYARHSETCIMADYNMESLIDATKIAVNLSHEKKLSMIQKGHWVAEHFSSEQEKNGLLKVLESLE